jgi:hypothetical protein
MMVSGVDRAVGVAGPCAGVKIFGDEEGQLVNRVNDALAGENILAGDVESGDEWRGRVAIGSGDAE